MFGTVISAELKTRTLTSLPDGCAACAATTQIQDKTRRRLICVFICSSLFESARFNPKRGKGQGSGVEGRRNSSCHSTLIIRHSLAPDTLAPFALRQYQGPRPSTLNSNHTTPHPTNDAESVPAPSLTVTARLRTELIVHHLLLLLPSFFFLFFNPDP